MNAAADPPAPARRVSDEGVRDATGRGRDEWFALLDAWGGAGRSHGEIAAWLGEQGVAGWWAQTITVDYEQARGLRQPGGGRDGLFAISVSRTVGAPVELLFVSFVDPALRERWLSGGGLRLRTSPPGRTLRFDWENGATRIQVDLAEKSGNRSQVTLTHERLPDAGAAEEARAHWRERLDALRSKLER